MDSVASRVSEVKSVVVRSKSTTHLGRGHHPSPNPHGTNDHQQHLSLILGMERQVNSENSQQKKNSFGHVASASRFFLLLSTFSDTSSLSLSLSLDSLLFSCPFLTTSRQVRFLFIPSPVDLSRTLLFSLTSFLSLPLFTYPTLTLVFLV